MKVGELQEALAKLDSQHDVMILLNGAFVPVTEVAVFNGLDFIILRGPDKEQASKKYTIQEQGLVGHLVRQGFDNEKIGHVLGRPTQNIKRARKKFGF